MASLKFREGSWAGTGRGQDSKCDGLAWLRALAPGLPRAPQAGPSGLCRSGPFPMVEEGYRYPILRMHARTSGGTTATL